LGPYDDKIYIVITLSGATGCHSLHWLVYHNNVAHSAERPCAWHEVINDSCQINIQTLYFCSRHWRFHQVFSIYSGLRSMRSHKLLRIVFF